MQENKTKPTAEDVTRFIESIPDEKKRNDSCRIIGLMSEITGEKPEMWGPSIIGFGSYHYRYDSGREGNWMLTGFSPRKQSISLYLMSGFVSSEENRFEITLGGLGKYKLGKGCLYINRLDDVDIDKLKELIRISVDFLREKYH